MNFDFLTNIESVFGSLALLIVASAVASIVSIALTVLFVISLWKIFVKANRKGWLALIPGANIFVLFDIVWDGNVAILHILLNIASAVVIPLGAGMIMSGKMVGVFLVILGGLVLLIDTILLIMLYIRLAYAFDHAFGFAVGLTILNPIFMMILAFGPSKYNIEGGRYLRAIKILDKVEHVLVTILIYLFLAIMAVIVLFPFYWMIISSLKSLEEYRYTVPTFWPHVIHFENYAKAFSAASLATLFRNTVIVGVISTILSLIITVLSAFAFARLEFKGKNVLFGALLATMMIPGELFTITNYATVSQLGWKQTYTVLIVPFLVSIFYIYLLRQNFLQIPNELYLAAKVDGTKDLKYLWKVMIPLSMPTLISITILKMMGAWNSYIWPRLVANDAAHRLITNGLRNAFQDTTGNTDYPVQMAAVALVSLPLFLVFLFLRKYIMKGVSRSGIKG